MNARHMSTKLRRLGLVALVAGVPCAALGAGAEHPSLDMPIRALEQRLATEELTVVEARGARFEGDRTQKTVLRFADGTETTVKWAAAPRSGGTVNNRPRYELAAYEIQKLLFDEDDWVVPPTVLRVVTPALQAEVAEAPPTFRKCESVLVVLQTWLNDVSPDDVFDLERFDTDPAYRRRLATLNVFTHLVWHNDTNRGNFLISTVGQPRIWAVDNGFAFGTMDESDRGFEWRELRVDRLPRDVVERLRAVDVDALNAALGVLAQFEIRDGLLVPVPKGENLNERQGIRRFKNVIQLGLNNKELFDVRRRLRRLLHRVDEGKIELF